MHTYTYICLVGNNNCCYRNITLYTFPVFFFIKMVKFTNNDQSNNCRKPAVVKKKKKKKKPKISLSLQKKKLLRNTVNEMGLSYCVKNYKRIANCMNVTSLRTEEGYQVVLEYIKTIIPNNTLLLLNGIESFDSLCTLLNIHSSTNRNDVRTMRTLFDNNANSYKLVEEVEHKCLELYVKQREIIEQDKQQTLSRVHKCKICNTSVQTKADGTILYKTLVRDEQYSQSMAGKKMFSTYKGKLKDMCSGCIKKYNCSGNGCGCTLYNGVACNKYCTKCTTPSFDANNSKRCNNCKSRDRVKRQSIACKTPPPRKNSKFRRTPVRDKDFMYYDLQTEQILKEKQDFDVCVARSKNAKEKFVTQLKNIFHYTYETIENILTGSS